MEYIWNGYNKMNEFITDWQAQSSRADTNFKDKQDFVTFAKGMAMIRLQHRDLVEARIAVGLGSDEKKTREIRFNTEMERLFKLIQDLIYEMNPSTINFVVQSYSGPGGEIEFAQNKLQRKFDFTSRKNDKSH